MIREENLITLSGDFLPGQRLTKIGDTFVPVGFGVDKVPGTTVVKDIGKGLYYKCTSVGNTTWSGNKAFQNEDGTWSFEDAVTSGLAFTEIKPEKGKVYSFDALVEVKLWNGSAIPEGHIWGYNRGTLLEGNTITATNNGVSADSNGYYTFGYDKYFDFDSTVMTGAAQRSFVIQVSLMDNGEAVQFIDAGGPGSTESWFGIGWGYEYNKIFHHFYHTDNTGWIDLPAGDYVLAFVYDGTALKAYKDGDVVGTLTTELKTGTDYNYRIGQYVVDDWYSMGEWKSNYCIVYDYALSEDEVQALTDYIKER